MIAKAKQQEIVAAAQELLKEGALPATPQGWSDKSVLRYALKRVHEPLSDEKDGVPGNTEADRQMMYEVLVYRINRYRDTDTRIRIKEL